MIWLTDHIAETQHEELFRYLHAELDRICALADVSIEFKDELITSVALHIMGHHTTFSSDLIDMMLISGLMGTLDAECRYGVSERLGIEPRISYLLKNRDYSEGIWRVVTSGLLKPGRSSVYSRQNMWKLNLRKLRVESSQALELWFLQAIKHLILETACIWDETSGEGILKISGVPSVREHVKSNYQPLSRVSGQLRPFCRAVFVSLQQKRNWKKTPEILL